MKSTKLQYVGLFRSVSKKDNTPFGIVYLTGEPDEHIADKCVGVVGYKLFVGGNLLSTFESMRVGQSCTAYIYNQRIDNADGTFRYEERLLDAIPIK